MGQLKSLYRERRTMKKIALLSLFTLAILQPLAEAQRVSMEDSSCEAGKECIPDIGCEFFTTARVKLNNMSRGSHERQILVEKLKSLVCNKERKKVCCDNSRPTPGVPGVPQTGFGDLLENLRPKGGGLTSTCPNYGVSCSLNNALPGVNVTTVNTPSECGVNCQGNLGKCNAWTMIPKDPAPDARCFFLSRCERKISVLFRGFVSGDRSCPSDKGALPSCPSYDVICIDDDNSNNNILNESNPRIVKSPEECGRLCGSDPSCQFWTMIPNELEPPANCYQLSGCGRPRKRDRAVSGAATCPPS